MPISRTSHRIRFFPQIPALSAFTALAGLLLFSSVGAAQQGGLAVHKLTPAGQTFSDVLLDDPSGPKISSDGKWVAYWFDGDTDTVHDLYIASRFGGDVRRVSAPRPVGGLVPGNTVIFQFSEDNRYLLFLLDQETAGRSELWSVPVEGGPGDAVKLSAPIGADASVGEFGLGSDGRSVVFRINRATSSELWTAPADASSAAILLHPAGPPNSDIYTFLSANGRTIFALDLVTAGMSELWSVPSDGSAAPVRLNGDFVSGGNIVRIHLTPDGQRAIYRADQRFDGVEELFSVPITGPSTASVRISPDMPAFGDVLSVPRPTSDGSHLLFLADTGVDAQRELWSVPVDGPATAAVHLNVALVAGGNVVDYNGDGAQVVYVVDNLVDEQMQAYIVPIGGPFTASVRLHQNLPSGGDVLAAAAVPSDPDPVAVLVGDLRADGQLEFFVQHLDGVGAPHPLFGTVPVGATLDSTCLGGALPDFSAFFECADLDSLGKVELWRFDIAFDSEPQRLSSFAAIAAADVTRAIVSPDGRFVAFRSDNNVDERFDLFRVPTDGSAFPVRVHATPASPAFDVTPGENIFFTPDSQGIVYAADHELNGQDDLWISDAMVFRADFEEGSTVAWSQTLP